MVFNTNMISRSLNLIVSNFYTHPRFSLVFIPCPPSHRFEVLLLGVEAEIQFVVKFLRLKFFGISPYRWHQERSDSKNTRKLEFSGLKNVYVYQPLSEFFFAPSL